MNYLVRANMYPGLSQMGHGVGLLIFDDIEAAVRSRYPAFNASVCFWVIGLA